MQLANLLCLIGLLASATLVVAGERAAVAGERAFVPSERAFARPPKILVYTVSAGYEHDVARRETPEALSIVEAALVALGRTSGAFEAVCSRDAGEFEPEKLARYELVFFYTTGELPLSQTQRDALLAFVREGKGFAGAHCATDTLDSVPEYGALLGARFDGHPWHERVRIRVEDREHGATRHLGPTFEIEDEIYQFKEPYDRARLHVLASLDTTALDLERAGVRRTDADFAIAWTREHGKGRVFYTALGHRAEVWRDQRFLAHLAGGIRWAIGRQPQVGASVPPADVREYATFAAEHAGDPARGFKLFRDATRTMCVRCHTVFGTGAAVGPDLSDIAARRSREEIVQALLEPSRDVEDVYRTTSFELEDGTFVAGQVRHEKDGTIELVDTEGAVRTISASTVATRRASSSSIMPDGLAKLLSKDEFADLVAYLATLRGAPGK